MPRYVNEWIDGPDWGYRWDELPSDYDLDDDDGPTDDDTPAWVDTRDVGDPTYHLSAGEAYSAPECRW
jgi:hypothetical protein